MIIVPDDPGPVAPDEVLKANVIEVFDGDGFLANVWHPVREVWVQRIPFRFAFIDAPEMGQPFGSDTKNFLNCLIVGKTLRLDPIGKESTGGMPIDPYKRMLCMGFLTEQLALGQIEYYRNGACSTGSVKVARPIVRNVELEMIVNGWAWVVNQYSFDREHEYFEAQQNAQHHRRGLWAQNSPEPPWIFKRKQRRHSRRNEGQGRLF